MVNIIQIAKIYGKKRLFHELWTTVLEIVKSWNHKCHCLPFSSSPPSPLFRSNSPAIILENGCSKISQNRRGGFCFYFLQHVVPRILRQIFLGISSIDYCTSLILSTIIFQIHIIQIMLLLSVHLLLLPQLFEFSAHRRNVILTAAHSIRGKKTKIFYPCVPKFDSSLTHGH